MRIWRCNFHFLVQGWGKQSPAIAELPSALGSIVWSEMTGIGFGNRSFGRGMLQGSPILWFVQCPLNKSRILPSNYKAQLFPTRILHSLSCRCLLNSAEEKNPQDQGPTLWRHCCLCYKSGIKVCSPWTRPHLQLHKTTAPRIAWATCFSSVAQKWEGEKRLEQNLNLWIFITCSMTSSWECSVSKSLTRSCRTRGWRSWWHVLICKPEGKHVRSSRLLLRDTFLKHILDSSVG